MDFTLTTYSGLLKALQKSGYSFQTVEQFITEPLDKVVIMRHDVDRLPGNALRMARLEKRVVREFTRMITNMNEEWKYLLCSSQRQISFIACGEVG